MERTRAWYRRFSRDEAAGRSPLYVAWADGVARDDALLARLQELPPEKRQPNLLFACARWLGVDDRPLDAANDADASYARFRAEVLSLWPRVSAAMRQRATQTNEPGRTASILPVLQAIEVEGGGAPLALVEVGASAGLCLYPDRYSFEYADAEGGAGGAVTLHPVDGPSPVVLRTVVSRAVPLGSSLPLGRELPLGSSLPLGSEPPLGSALPRIGWRAGLDLDPVDVDDPEALRWFLTLLWPEERDRRSRIEAAVDIVRRDPPLLVSGDAVDDLERLVARAPRGTTVVVVTAGVLAYLPPERRARFADTVARLGVRWISNEGERVLPRIAERLGAMPGAAATASEAGRFVVALDGEPVAVAGAHGQWMRWLADPGFAQTPRR